MAQPLVISRDVGLTCHGKNTGRPKSSVDNVKDFGRLDVAWAQERKEGDSAPGAPSGGGKAPGSHILAKRPRC